MDKALMIADACDTASPVPDGLYSTAAEELRRQSAEIARLNKCLTWEQNRAERIGTHGPGCAYWGPVHYECLVRTNEALVDALQHAISIYGKFDALVNDPRDPGGWIMKARAAVEKARKE